VQGVRALDRLEAIGRLPDHIYIRVLSEQRADDVTEDGMIIDEQHSYWKF
jgi:hypothetical protein